MLRLSLASHNGYGGYNGYTGGRGQNGDHGYTGYRRVRMGIVGILVKNYFYKDSHTEPHGVDFPLSFAPFSGSSAY